MSAPGIVHGITVHMEVKIIVSMMIGASVVLSTVEIARVNLSDVGNLWVPIEPSMCTPYSYVLEVYNISI